MKIHIIDNFRNDFIIFSCFFLFAFIWLINAPALFNLHEPDSLSYINGDAIRTSIYPFIIDFFYNENTKYFNLIYFQIFLLTFSSIILLFILRRKGQDLFFISMTYFFLFTNVYYISFAKTILTEAIFFSLINFAMSLLILEKKLLNSYILSSTFGLIIGGIYAIKSVGFIIFFFFFFGFFYFSIKYKTIKKLFVCLIFSALLPVLEHKLYFDIHESRSNVVNKSFTGKIFILSGYPKLKFENFNENYKSFLSIFKNDSKLVNNYISNLKNPFLIANLKADYEVVGQYQYDKQINDFKINSDIENIDDFKKKLGLKIIFNNPIEFLKMSLWHYFGLWVPGGKQLFTKHHENLPLTSKLKSSSGDIMFLKKEILIIAISFFLLLFFFFTLFSIQSILIILRREWKKFDVFNILCLICQTYLIIVSLSNIATPRYLMPFFPLVVIIFCLYLKEMFIILKKSLNVRSH